MWHAIAPVTNEYNTILFESPEESKALVLNAGPGSISIQAWSNIETFGKEPKFTIELRPGDQRILGGHLIRAQLVSGQFAAIGWRLIFAEN